MMVILRLVEESSAGHAQGVDLLGSGQRTAELNAGDFLVAVTGRADDWLSQKPREDVHGYGLNPRARLLDGERGFQAWRVAHAVLLRQLAPEALLGLEY